MYNAKEVRNSILRCFKTNYNESAVTEVDGINFSGMDVAINDNGSFYTYRIIVLPHGDSESFEPETETGKPS